MQTDNLILARGAGEYSHDFNPQLDLDGTESIFIRIEEKVAPRYVLKGVNDGGDGHEVVIDDINNLITMNLSEAIRNVIPDIGWTIKVFINDEIAVFGTLTNSGAAAEGTTASPITITNQFNTKSISGNASIKSDDDIIYGAPDAAVEFTLTIENAASLLPEKRYIIVNTGQGDIVVNDVDDNPVIAVGPSGRVWIQSHGSVWLTFFTN